MLRNARHIAIAAFGTLGDVFPIVGLAANLAKHCELTVVTSATYADYFRSTSCRVVEVLGADEHRAALDGVAISTRDGTREYLTRYLVASLRMSIAALLDADRLHPVDAFLGTGFINGAQWAAEILGKPYIRISLSPWSDKDVMLEEMGSPNRAAHFARMCVARAMLQVSALYQYTFVDEHLNPIRREFGLRTYGATELFTRPHAALRIALYPTSLVRNTSGHRPAITFTSFPLSDPSNDEIVRLTEDALGLCKQKPLVFVTGSAVTDILRDVQYAYSLCSRLGIPGIFVHSKVIQLGKRAFTNLALLAFADLSCLLPRALLIVHHGGIGTIAQSLRAGIPQLVRPLAFDQVDNARRMSRLKTGTFLPAEQRHDVELSAALVSHLTSNPDVSTATEKHRTEIAHSDGLRDATGSILQFLDRSTADGR